MARKTLADLKRSSKQREFGKLGQLLIDGMESRHRHRDSWIVIGVDTSLSSIAMAGIGFDSTFGKMTKLRTKDVRWTSEDRDWFERLSVATKAHELAIEVTPIGVPLERVFIFIEEPVPMGMIAHPRGSKSGWIKQQCEISGAVCGGLYRWGFKNIVQINNQQWKSALKKEGYTIAKMPEGKFDVKAAMIDRFGMPDLPDLVKSKTGSKIPRPAEGFGAKAKAVQPDDCYDAAACMLYGIIDLQERGVTE